MKKVCLVLCSLFTLGICEPPLSNYGLLDISSNSYNPPHQQNHRDVSSHNSPSGTYGVPSHSYGSPSESLTPSGTYGIPSNSHFPNELYGGPSHNLHHNNPSNSYGVPSYQNGDYYNSNHGSNDAYHSGDDSGYGQQHYPSDSYGVPREHNYQHSSGVNSHGYDSQHAYGQRHGDDDYQYGPGSADYKYEYQVQDPVTGGDFGHSETRHGESVHGHYHVNLPESKQSVQYENGIDDDNYDGDNNHYSGYENDGNDNDHPYFGY